MSATFDDVDPSALGLEALLEFCRGLEELVRSGAAPLGSYGLLAGAYRELELRQEAEEAPGGEGLGAGLGRRGS